MRQKILAALVAALVEPSFHSRGWGWVSAERVATLCGFWNVCDFVQTFRSHSKDAQYDVLGIATKEGRFFNANISDLSEVGREERGPVAPWEDIYLPAGFIEDILVDHLMEIEMTDGDWEELDYTYSSLEIGRFQILFYWNRPNSLSSGDERVISEKEALEIVKSNIDNLRGLVLDTDGVEE